VPTFETTKRFVNDFAKLSTSEQARFERIVKERFVPDLASGTFRAGLRVKGIQGAEGVFEMTWAPDGRATFQYGAEHVAGEPHVIWRRVGTHDVFERPPGP
jgi:hypothetical protein